VRSIDQPTAIWPRPRHIRFLVARLGNWRELSLGGQRQSDDDARNRM